MSFHIRRSFSWLCETSQSDDDYKPKVILSVLFVKPSSHRYSLTAFSRVDDDNFAEWPISLIVVHSNLDFKGGEGRESLISVFVCGRISRSHHLLLPSAGPVGTKRNNVPEALAILELLRHRLKTSEGEKQCRSLKWKCKPSLLVLTL